MVSDGVQWFQVFFTLIWMGVSVLVCSFCGLVVCFSGVLPLLFASLQLLILSILFRDDSSNGRMFLEMEAHPPTRSCFPCLENGNPCLVVLCGDNRNSTSSVFFVRRRDI